MSSPSARAEGGDLRSTKVIGCVAEGNDAKKSLYYLFPLPHFKCRDLSGLANYCIRFA